MSRDAAIFADARSALARLAPEDVQPLARSNGTDAPPPDRSRAPIKTLAFVRASEVIPRAVSWAWNGRIPLGTLTMIEGRMGTGKTTMTAAITAAITTGHALPGALPGSHIPPADAILVSLEDDAATTITPRLHAAGADLHRVHLFKGFEYNGKVTDDVLNLSEDIERLRLAIRTTGARVVSIDPLMAAIGHRIDANSDQDSRSITAQLRNVAEETGAAILLVRHFRKAASAAEDAGGGSVGWGAACRSVLRVDKDPERAGRYLLSSVKCSLAERPPTLSFTIEGVTFSGPPEIATSRLVWGEASTWTADALASLGSSGEEQSKGDEARDFLAHTLGAGAKSKHDVLAAMRKEGILLATLDRAATKMGVNKKRDGFACGSVWSLPASFNSSEPHSPHLCGPVNDELNGKPEVNEAPTPRPLPVTPPHLTPSAVEKPESSFVL